MDARAYGWTKAGLDMWTLYAESAVVMSLRATRIMAGGNAGLREAELMVTEKIQAAIELQAGIAGGTLGTTPLGATKVLVEHFRRKVAANRRRLQRSNG